MIHLEETSGKKLYLRPEWSEGLYLYPGEVKRLKLKDGDILSEEDIENIRKEYIIPRAKKRALGILSKRDCSRQQMIEKMQKSLYDDKSVQDAVEFLERMGYLDDLSYAREYVYYKRKKKSIRQISFDLQRKGISQDLIARAIEEEGGCQRRDELRSVFMKYASKYQKEDPRSRQKIYMHFARKGYDREIISELLEEWIEEM